MTRKVVNNTTQPLIANMASPFNCFWQLKMTDTIIKNIIAENDNIDCNIAIDSVYEDTTIKGLCTDSIVTLILQYPGPNRGYVRNNDLSNNVTISRNNVSKL